MKIKLTQKVCQEIICPANKRENTIWDSEITGLGLKITINGIKTFVLKHCFNGQQVKETIGRYPILTVDQARKEAMRRRVLALQGVDTREQRKAEWKSKSALRQSDISDISNEILGNDTMGFLAARYLEYCKTTKKSFRNYEYRLRKHILPVIGNRQIETITKTDIKALHDKLGEQHTYEANRVHSLLSSMFTFGIKNDIIREQFINPCKWVSKHREKSRDRFMTHEEWERIEDALQEETDIYAVAAIRLDILTGLRKNELLSLRWDYVHFDKEGKEYLYLPDSKAGRPFDVPLSIAAVKLLKSIPKFNNNPHVFPSSITPGGHIVDMKRVWNRVRRKAGLMDIHFHDIRRTFGSWLAEDGVSLHLIGKLLNQTTSQVTEVYARFQRDAGRELLNKHAEKILSFKDIKEK